MNGWLGIGITVLLLAANFFFVGAEFSLIAARRSTIEPLAEEGSPRARQTLQAMERITEVMAGAQLGITIASLLLGSVAEPVIAQLIRQPLALIGITGTSLHVVAFIIAFSLVVYFHIVIGEMVPKNLALARPERLALYLGPPMLWITKAMLPIIKLFNGIANIGLKLLGVEPKEEVHSAYSREEVALLVEESLREGLLDEDERDLLSGALEFEGHTVQSVLLPVSRMETVPVDVTPAQVEHLVAQTGYSRFPVLNQEREPVGYLHLKDALDVSDYGQELPIPTRVIRPFAKVNRTDKLDTALRQLQKAGQHLALVHDQQGKACGIVTFEDVVEKLVGEIQDESQNQND